MMGELNRQTSDPRLEEMTINMSSSSIRAEVIEFKDAACPDYEREEPKASPIELAFRGEST
jgi:hypothetical protein